MENCEHTQDSDCTVDPTTDCCTECGVHYGDECPECGMRGYHAKDCRSTLHLHDRRDTVSPDDGEIRALLVEAVKLLRASFDDEGYMDPSFETENNARAFLARPEVVALVDTTKGGE